jgi:hypothetical protein
MSVAGALEHWRNTRIFPEIREVKLNVSLHEGPAGSSCRYRNGSAVVRSVSARRFTGDKKSGDCSKPP